MTKYGAFLQVRGFLARYFNCLTVVGLRCAAYLLPLNHSCACKPSLPLKELPPTTKSVQATDRDAPPEWRGKFFRYKALKKALKDCAPCASPRACHSGTVDTGGQERHAAEGEPAAAAADAQSAAQPPAAGAEAGGATGGASEAEVLFFELLKSELLRVNRCAVGLARRWPCARQVGVHGSRTSLCHHGKCILPTVRLQSPRPSVHLCHLSLPVRPGALWIPPARWSPASSAPRCGAALRAAPPCSACWVRGPPTMPRWQSGLTGAASTHEPTR